MNEEERCERSILWNDRLEDGLLTYYETLVLFLKRSAKNKRDGEKERRREQGMNARLYSSGGTRS